MALDDGTTAHVARHYRLPHCSRLPGRGGGRPITATVTAVTAAGRSDETFGYGGRDQRNATASDPADYANRPLFPDDVASTPPTPSDSVARDRRRAWRLSFNRLRLGGFDDLGSGHPVGANEKLAVGTSPTAENDIADWVHHRRRRQQRGDAEVGRTGRGGASNSATVTMADGLGSQLARPAAQPGAEGRTAAQDQRAVLPASPRILDTHDAAKNHYGYLRPGRAASASAGDGGAIYESPNSLVRQRASRGQGSCTSSGHTCTAAT